MSLFFSNRKSSCFLFILFALTSLQSCLSFSSFQTADTVKEGHGTFFVGVGYQQYAYLRKSEDEATKTVEQTIEKIKVPMIEYGLRYGFKPDLDIGIRTALFGAYVGDLKYRFEKTKEYSLATGLALSYASIGLVKDQRSRIIDIGVPLYASYNLSATNHLYGVPRIVLRQSQLTFLDESTSTSSTLVGATAGVAMGQDFQVFAEYSYFSGASEVDRQGVQQVMIGFNLGADNVDRFVQPQKKSEIN